MAKKSKGPKFPKRIAGVKVPKGARKTGTSLIRFAQTPIGSALVAEAIVASTVAVARNRQVQASAAEAGREATRFGAQIAQTAREAAIAAVAPIITAARTASEDRRAGGVKPISDRKEAVKPGKRRRESEDRPATTH